jgi:hypothetical protein
MRSTFYTSKDRRIDGMINFKTTEHPNKLLSPMLELQGNNNEELKNHCLTTMICLLFLVVMGITFLCLA